ncbi:MAG: adenylate/guanylate cyclase domain-containing protein [Gammaproteobacteria bacterium]|nr:adenylate/guanylate cyclase domain-containing protein [Gammaproteobacteria bacterium]
MYAQRIIRLALSAFILLALLLNTSNVVQFTFITQLENWSYDARLKFTLPDTQDDRIIIIDVDESSLEEIGRWPWGRDKLATLVDNLFNYYHASVVGFDIVFAEKDLSSGLSIFDDLANNELHDNLEFRNTLNKIRPSLEFDKIFANSLIGKKVVLGYYFKNKVAAGETGKTGALPASHIEINEVQRELLPISIAEGFVGNLKVLQDAAITGGFFNNPHVDQDGVFRRVSLLQSYENHLYPSLALATAQVYLNSLQVEPIFKTDGNYFALEAVSLQNYQIPVDINAAVYVPFRGLKGSFPYISAHTILRREAEPAILKDKIILLGSSAPGLLDLRSTPVQSIYPGVEVHANIISGILDRNIKHRPAWVIGYEFAILVLTAIIMAFLLPLLSPLLATVGTLGMSLLVITCTMLAWNNQLILPLASPMLLILLIFIWQMTFGYFIESRGKRQLAHLFGHYIPPELVDEMSHASADFSLDGENREMTVLFSDVRGFTTISEGMDPKQLTQLMNALLTPMTRVIHKYRGTIDKYMGDAIMSFWGAPMHDSEHARHALYAAIGMMQELKTIQADFQNRGWPEVNMGIGINTGDMNVGNMGSEFRMAYTVLGDAVNLGSRLEGLTKNYGVKIIVGQSTKKCIPEFVFRELDLVRVIGKNEPVAIFEPVGHKNDLDKATMSELRSYRQALKSFRQQNWDNAEVAFFNLNRTNPSRQLYQVYLQRVTYYRKNPPGDNWDGVFTHTSK